MRVLSTLTWDEHVVNRFLETWRKGRPEVPEVAYQGIDLAGARQELRAVAGAADEAEPLQAFIARTARSYLAAARMLEAIGDEAFTARSIEIYGAPAQRLQGARRSHHELASALLDNTADLAVQGVVPEQDLCLTAEEVRHRLGESFLSFFGDRAPVVVVDPALASKAAAGSRRVRLRGRTCFSEIDIDQLREHEGYVHAATKLNGKSQPILSCLGLSSPRTTLTQEGLATFAEVITQSLDVARLRRIALRIVAIQDALDGADFIEVFRRFLDGGQTESESARSAMRIFRGGDPRGGVVFTKDVVYLAGLVAVHTFLRKAIAGGHPALVRRLFVGRLSLSDLMPLSSAFDAGHLRSAAFVAPWATRLDRLSAHLAFSAAIDHVDLESFSLPGVGV